MFIRSAFLALLLSTGCGQPSSADFDAELTNASVRAVSQSAQGALAWANAWISEVKAQPSQLTENLYTTSSPALERMSGTLKATNRSVCGTLVTQLLQRSLNLTSSNFSNSFNKAMDGTCEVGTINGVQNGTSSPSAAQYQYKITTCPSTGSIKFTARGSIADVEAGDVLAVHYTDRTDITGHVMVVRSAPVADASLPAGPDGSTAYAVEVIDSTSTPHGTSTTYPDWRGGGAGEGLGHGTYVLYANTNGQIIASRWSPTEPDRFDTTIRPVAIGGLQ